MPGENWLTVSISDFFFYSPITPASHHTPKILSQK